MGKLQRCYVCGWAWAKNGLGGMCTPCYNKQYDGEDEKHAFADFTGKHDTGGFFPKNFGIVKDKFGYEER